ncbi:MAG: MGMT family protein [Candidatus Omnitrophica bacterium]|nr:MGMT family protein [Candidatus Omnitrophota bacterium]
MKRRQKILSTILKNDGFTPFQKKVYAAVLDIPSGEVRSYKWVAKKISHRRSYRAVGNALNKNPYPLMIPCHRVVASDGKIGGYSRGVALKKRILKAEGVDSL